MVSDYGEYLIDEYDFYWGKDINTLNKFILGDRIDKLVTFSVELKDLSPNTTYYYKPYAKNSEGESTGEVKSFKTEMLPAPKINIFIPSGNEQYMVGDFISISATITNCCYIGLYVDGIFVNGSEQNSNNYFYNYKAISAGTHIIRIVGRNTPGEKDPGTYTAEESVEINVLPGEVAPPEFSLPSGTYSALQKVTISCKTNGAVIRYTTDGSEPKATSRQYSRDIYLDSKTV